MARPARRSGRQAQVIGLLVALVQGCASVAPPPGGPPDKAPPKIITVKPESGSVVPNLKGDLVIQFDEVVDEMAGAGGGGRGTPGGLERQALLSPGHGPVNVEWHRSKGTVKPKKGWKPRVYRLCIPPACTHPPSH